MSQIQGEQEHQDDGNETTVSPQWRISCFKRAEVLKKHGKKTKKQFDSADYFMHAHETKPSDTECLNKKNFPKISKDRKKVFDSADHFMEQTANAQNEQKMQQMQIERRNPLIHKTRGRKIFDSADYFMEVQQKH